MTDTTQLLPDRDGVSRWTAQRKATLLSDIRAGKVSEADALARHNLTPEELTSWRRRERRFGPRGLMQTKLQVLHV